MKIYDCIIFYNEIDLLCLRLRLLSDVVDKFVIVELDTSFRGKKKERIFQNNKDVFHQYLDKIIYITNDEIESPVYKGDGDWSIEYFQRNLLSKALYHCDMDDLIMLSDVDEIPNPELLKNLDKWMVKTGTSLAQKYRRCGYGAATLPIRRLSKFVIGRMTVMEALNYMQVSCVYKNHYYYMNCAADGFWVGTMISKFKNLSFPQAFRDNRKYAPMIMGSGWHFSYLGGLDSVKIKLNSIVDGRPEIIEKMKKYNNDNDYIEHCLREGKDIFGRNDKANQFKFIDPTDIGLPNIDEIVDTYPQFFHKS